MTELFFLPLGIAFLAPLLAKAAPAILGGLGGAFDKSGGQNSSSTSEEEFLRNLLSNTSSSGSRSQTTDFTDPAQAAALIQEITSRTAPTQLDPNELNKLEQIEKSKANAQAQNLFQTVRGGAERQGVQDSTAGVLARAQAENTRGSAVGDISQKFALKRFALPAENEKLQASQRNSFLGLLNLLPRSSNSIFNNESTTSSEESGSSTRNVTGTTGVDQGGIFNRILNGAGGFLEGAAEGQVADEERGGLGLGRIFRPNRITNNQL